MRKGHLGRPLEALQAIKMLMQPPLRMQPHLMDLKALPSNRPLRPRPSLRPSRPQGQVARHLLVMILCQARMSL